ncbi:hypothetical protein BOTBODRAFT_139688, partial [Botryobasidium botryosum FD-172 SS1]
MAAFTGAAGWPGSEQQRPASPRSTSLSSMSSWLPSYPPAPRSPAYDGSARYYGDRERDPATNAYPAADGPWPDRERDRERDWLEYDRPPRSDWEWRRNGAPRGRSRSPGDD